MQKEGDGGKLVGASLRKGSGNVAKSPEDENNQQRNAGERAELRGNVNQEVNCLVDKNEKMNEKILAGLGYWLTWKIKGMRGF